MNQTLTAKPLFLLFLFLSGLIGTDSIAPTRPISTAAPAYYVAPDGDDSNPGSLTQPWRTIQHAANHPAITPGTTVYVRDGLYSERITITVSGTAGAEITFRNYAAETPILDGTGLPASAEVDSGAIVIVDQSHLTIEGFEIRHYRSDLSNVPAIGINVTGAAHHIQLRHNHIHHIETTASVDGNAHAIAVFGTQAPASIHDVIIEDNNLHDLILGESEAISLNGNVEEFVVTGNTIYDSDNIGVDIIGFEGVAPDPVYDQARHGLVSYNRIFGISSLTNSFYNSYTAGGIYVDGGRNIIIEGNIVYDNDYGIEVASEDKNGSTEQIIIRHNWLFRNTVTGILLGGVGRTEQTTLTNNTFYHNDTLRDGVGELLLQSHTDTTLIQNNIFYTNEQNLFIEDVDPQNSGNVADNNLYFATAGPNAAEWRWQGIAYQGFDTYRVNTGHDTQSLFADPALAAPAQNNLHLTPLSPAIDAGKNGPAVGLYDIDHQSRPANDQIDIGADEYYQPSLFLPLVIRGG